jgi:hypothetical protein
LIRLERALIKFLPCLLEVPKILLFALLPYLYLMLVMQSLENIRSRRLTIKAKIILVSTRKWLRTVIIFIS